MQACRSGKKRRCGRGQRWTAAGAEGGRCGCGGLGDGGGGLGDGGSGLGDGGRCLGDGGGDVGRTWSQEVEVALRGNPATKTDNLVVPPP